MLRESNLDTQITVIGVFIRLPGISIEDSEKLLAFLIENGLRSIGGVEELKIPSN